MPDPGTLADRVIAMARRLPERDFAMLKLFHGIDGETYSIEEIARIFKVTRERARQKIDKATRRLMLAVSEEELSETTLNDMIVAGLMRERETEAPR